MIQSEMDIVAVRQLVKQQAALLKFSLVDQTKIVTAASEIARNVFKYGGGGQLLLETVEKEAKVGLKMVFEDQGPGIADINQALEDGYTTGKGMGLGLSGSKRLMDEFSIESELNKGTRVTLVKWK